MTLQQGIHYGISAETYHSDPCEQPSLSSSGVKALLSGSPAEFAALHPRLTQWPEWARKKGTRSQDLGTLAHSLILGEHVPFMAMDPEDLFPDIRTKQGKPYQTWSGDAKGWKDQQEAQGVIFASKADHAAVQSAVDSMRKLMISEYGDWPIGESEVTLLWQSGDIALPRVSHHDNTEYARIWCRARLDHWSPRFMVILDPKFTEISISDVSLAKMAAAGGWHIQQAWYLSGLAATAPSALRENIGKVRFRFPVAELNPPYQSRFYDLPSSWREIAEEAIGRASKAFAKALHSGEWPGYPKVCEAPPPFYLANDYENRMLALMEGRLESE